MNVISLIRKARMILFYCSGLAISCLGTGCLVSTIPPVPFVGVGGPGFGLVGVGGPGFGFPGFYGGPPPYGYWHYHGGFPYYGYYGWHNGYYGCHHCHGVSWHRW